MDTPAPTPIPAKDKGEPVGAWAEAAALSFKFMFGVVYLLAIGWVFSNFRLVPADSRAVVLRFGEVVRQEGAGLLMAFPRPIESVIVLPSAERQIGFNVEALQPAYNGDPYEQPEPGVVSIPISRDPRENTGLFLTGDFSVIHLDATLYYKITDATAYVLAADHIAAALTRAFIASAVSVCASRDLDTIIVARPELNRGTDDVHASRERFRTDLMDEVNRRLADVAGQGSGLGITVNRVDLVPAIPAQAKYAFDFVLVAVQQAETKAAEARTQAELIMQEANQGRDRLLTEAQAKAEEQVNDAKTRTAAIAALAQRAQGLPGDMLATQIYYDRIGALLGKAAQVLTTDGEGGSHVIVPGANRK